ncbi:hypothetical protein E2C01_056004 [Portunus trituberculatus]|uniref:Uncharacterized protein n=1 Tax=Portunus trituberculatus TaxID=210409 RepID=A0A5B7GXT7_PORTR|nr:hypothetical protein [Portunus trituberculatus]
MAWEGQPRIRDREAHPCLGPNVPFSRANSLYAGRSRVPFIAKRDAVRGVKLMLVLRSVCRPFLAIISHARHFTADEGEAHYAN